MLAQNFKPASDLDLSEPQLSALIKTLVLLETGKLKHVPDAEGSEWPTAPLGFTGHFNMDQWCLEHRCGTVACIGGTAELVGRLEVSEFDTKAHRNRPLHNLFYPSTVEGNWGAITPAQAAIALRSYLTTGDSRWDLAVRA